MEQIALSEIPSPLYAAAVGDGLKKARGIPQGQPQQKEQEQIKIEFERRSVIGRPGPCAVCNGKGGWDVRSRFDERIVGHKVCRWCGGRGRIG